MAATLPVSGLDQRGTVAGTGSGPASVPVLASGPELGPVPGRTAGRSGERVSRGATTVVVSGPQENFVVSSPESVLEAVRRWLEQAVP
ncbi:hypothetical protein [Streptomyces sp. NPDC054863]